MLKKLHAYTIKSFIGPWISTFFIAVFLLLMQFLWKYIDDLVGKGLEWYIIAELLLYASLTLVPLALPMSILLASIMTYGGMGERYELFAMKSGGISLRRIIYPLFILNIFISIGAFYFANNLLPYTNLKMRALLYGIQQQRPEVNLQSGIFTEPVDDFIIKVDRKYRRDNDLENIIIYDHRNQSGNKNVTTSKSGNLQTATDKELLIFDLYNGYRYEELSGARGSTSKSKYPHQRMAFKQKTVFIEMDGLGLDRDNEELFKSGFEMLNNQQLIIAADSIQQRLRKRENDVWVNLTSYNLFRAQKKPEQDIESDKLLTAFNKYEPEIEEKNLARYDFDSLYYSLSRSDKNKVIDFALNFGRTTRTYTEVTNAELIGYKRWIARHHIEYHRKYSVAVACLIFFLLGAPLGAIIRKGGYGLPVIVSVFIFLFYYVVSITFEKMVREVVIIPEIGMWISTFVLFPVTIFIFYKANTDSLRVSPHFYRRIIKIFIKDKDNINT